MAEPVPASGSPIPDARTGERPTGERLTFRICGPITRDDLPGLCDRVCALLAAHSGPDVDCDVHGVPADAVTIEALARLQLAARRRSCTIHLRGASDDLRELVTFLGLANVLPERP